MNLVTRFVEQVRAAPERPAIIATQRGREQQITYRELDRMSGQVATYLKQLGLQNGDTALVFQPMSIELYAILIGLWKLGATAQFIDPSGGPRLIERSCQLLPPKAFIAIGKAHLYRFASKAIRAIPIKLRLGWSLLPARPLSRAYRCDPYREIAKVAPDSPALITFTSGSTGNPKGAPRSHKLLLAQHDALIDAIELRPGERDLATLPIFALANLASGLTTLIPDCDLSRPGFIDPERVMEQIARHNPQRSVASPAFFLRLCAHAAERNTTLPFRKLYTGGAPVFPRYLDTMQQSAPSADIFVVYGSTEAEPIAHAHKSEYTPDVIERAQSGQGLLVGKPIAQATVRIIRDQSERPLPLLDEKGLDRLIASVGESGEIVVTGAHTLPGYLNAQGDAENKIRVGSTVWHRTGDAGYFDHEGRLWLLGRCGSKIERAYGFAYPFSVEAAASMDKRVKWSALVSLNGKSVLAVELANGAAPFSMDDLRLPENAVDELRFIDSMPLDKRHNAKIDYPTLRTRLAKR